MNNSPRNAQSHTKSAWPAERTCKTSPAASTRVECKILVNQNNFFETEINFNSTFDTLKTFSRRI